MPSKYNKPQEAYPSGFSPYDELEQNMNYLFAPTVIKDFPVASPHSFVAANVAPGAAIKTDG